MTMGARSKRRIAQDLADICNSVDELYTRIQGEWVRPKAFDRTALVLSGILATLPILLQELMQDIHEDEESTRMAELMKDVKPLDPPTKDSV